MTEINKIYHQCDTLLSALMRHSDLSAQAFGVQRIMAETAFRKHDLKYLSRSLKELVSISKDFPEQVTEDLLNELGLKLVDQSKKVKSILKKGKISTDSEFRLVNEFADEIHSDEKQAGLMDEINKVLIEYEQKKDKDTHSS